MLDKPEAIVMQLRRMQDLIRNALWESRSKQDLNEVSRESSADTIYGIDAVVEPIIEAFCHKWGRKLPMLVICEGMEPETGRPFPGNLRPEDALVRLIIDPIDGTRQLMYDKRSAWSLAAIAPNKGPGTRLGDIEVAVMTELPTSKQGLYDVLWAVRGKGAHLETIDICGASAPNPIPIRPSTAPSIDHGYASISSFFPGTKVLAAELMETIAHALAGPADVHRATVFDDQYISTAGQFYELLIGHDRFNADLRSLFYKIQNLPEGLCVHPYDACCALIATEAGVILTDALGNPLDGPLDTLTSLSWAGFANAQIRAKVEPIMRSFLLPRLASSRGGDNANRAT